MTPDILFEQIVSDFPELKRKLLVLFKSPDQALSWLTNPKWQLGGRSPAECLENDLDAVLDLIRKIKQGDFS